ncbi:MAG TPA: SOS response-associated peptidase, partial [Burkholderiaceae bacterium]|nr:SOS response-associated peptidase [Burkholderiaceae bacterium]
PTDRGPIVRLDREGARECTLARWGLVPPWAKDLAFGTRCINARSETVASTSAFRIAYRKRRCLVPLVAFYEWSGPKGKRLKHRITLPEEPLFALAGLWEWWRDPATPEGPGVETYTIITTAANSAIAAARPHAGDPARRALRRLARSGADRRRNGRNAAAVRR